MDKIFDLTKYKTVIDEEGIDFHDVGKNSSITKSAAKDVFKEMSSNDRKLNVDFLKNFKFWLILILINFINKNINF